MMSGVLFFFVLVLCSRYSAAQGGPPKCNRDILKNVKAGLFDLEGTIYENNTKLVDGLNEKFIDARNVTLGGSADTLYMVVSNTFMSPSAVRQKLGADGLVYMPDVENVKTAGEAIATYLEANAPAGARIFVVGTTYNIAGERKENMISVLKDLAPKATATTEPWEMRTDLQMNETNVWAGETGTKTTYVVLATDGDATDEGTPDPVTNKSGYQTMDYELMTKVHRLLRNGATLVVGSPGVVKVAPEVAGSVVDNNSPDIGAFEQYFLSSAQFFKGTTLYNNNYVNVGLGGKDGGKFLQSAISRVNDHFNGTAVAPQEIAIIGDSLISSIKAGNEANLTTILVTGTGANQLEDVTTLGITPTCYIPTAAELPVVPGLASAPA